MMLRRICFTLLFCFTYAAWGADGLVAVKNQHPPKETIDRLEKLVKEKGMTVFARVDHAAGAAKVGKTLRPTELLIFGNPQGGTPLMECAKGQSWLGYNDPAWIVQRQAA